MTKAFALFLVSAVPLCAAVCPLGPTVSPSGSSGASVTFGVWAPHATSANVAPAANGTGASPAWQETAMQSAGSGVWCATVAGAVPGDGYNYVFSGPSSSPSSSAAGGVVEVRSTKMMMEGAPVSSSPVVRCDPRARAVSLVPGGPGAGGGCGGSGAAASVVHDPSFEWRGAPTVILDASALVIYEMHVQTFTSPQGPGTGTFDSAAAQIPHLQKLGIKAVELLPTAYFPGPSAGWGYNPGSPFAIHPDLGGYDGLRRFVRACNSAGIGVILDVVLNHMDASNVLDVFDGWSGDAGTGIYFFQGTKKETPWGPRPDYATEQVSTYLADWLVALVEECHVSGFRWDSTICMRLGGDPSAPCWNSPDDIPTGWKMFQKGNLAIQSLPGGARFSAAEDTKNFLDVTLPVSDSSAGVPGATGGGGFTRQWGEKWYYSFEPQLTASDNADVNMASVAALLANRAGEDPHRVLYVENHDKASNQQTGRIPSVVDPGGHAWAPTYWALKKAAMGVSAMMVSTGTPMLFYGQELVSYDAFQFPVPPPLNWSLAETNSGFVQLVSDIVNLRTSAGSALACPGPATVLDVVDDGTHKLASILRSCTSGSGSATILAIVNMDRNPHPAYALSGLPSNGMWPVVFNGDSKAYSDQFGGFASGQSHISVSNGAATIQVPPYAVLLAAAPSS